MNDMRVKRKTKFVIISGQTGFINELIRFVVLRNQENVQLT